MKDLLGEMLLKTTPLPVIPVSVFRNNSEFSLEIKIETAEIFSYYHNIYSLLAKDIFIFLIKIPFSKPKSLNLNHF